MCIVWGKHVSDKRDTCYLGDVALRYRCRPGMQFSDLTQLFGPLPVGSRDLNDTEQLELENNSLPCTLWEDSNCHVEIC